MRSFRTVWKGIFFALFALAASAADDNPKLDQLRREIVENGASYPVGPADSFLVTGQEAFRKWQRVDPAIEPIWDEIATLRLKLRSLRTELLKRANQQASQLFARGHYEFLEARHQVLYAALATLLAESDDLTEEERLDTARYLSIVELRTADQEREPLPPIALATVPADFWRGFWLRRYANPAVPLGESLAQDGALFLSSTVATIGLVRGPVVLRYGLIGLGGGVTGKTALAIVGTAVDGDPREATEQLGTFYHDLAVTMIGGRAATRGVWEGFVNPFRRLIGRRSVEPTSRLARSVDGVGTYSQARLRELARTRSSPHRGPMGRAIDWIRHFTPFLPNRFRPGPAVTTADRLKSLRTEHDRLTQQISELTVQAEQLSKTARPNSVERKAKHELIRELHSLNRAVAQIERSMAALKRTVSDHAVDAYLSAEPVPTSKNPISWLRSVRFGTYRRNQQLWERIPSPSTEPQPFWTRSGRWATWGLGATGSVAVGGVIRNGIVLGVITPLTSDHPGRPSEGTPTDPFSKDKAYLENELPVMIFETRTQTGALDLRFIPISYLEEDWKLYTELQASPPEILKSIARKVGRYFGGAVPAPLIDAQLAEHFKNNPNSSGHGAHYGAREATIIRLHFIDRELAEERPNETDESRELQTIHRFAQAEKLELTPRLQRALSPLVRTARKAALLPSQDFTEWIMVDNMEARCAFFQDQYREGLSLPNADAESLLQEIQHRMNQAIMALSPKKQIDAASLSSLTHGCLSAVPSPDSPRASGS